MKESQLFKDFINNDKLVQLPTNTTPHFRISQYGIIEHENKILLIKDGRSGQWEFPGGGLDFGETLLVGYSREIKEETGYEATCEPHPIVCSTDFLYHSVKDIYAQTLNLFFISTLTSAVQGDQNLDTPDEITDVKWILVDDLKSHQLIAYHQKARDIFLEKRNNG